MATSKVPGERMSVIDLPADILYSIFPYLTASEYLSFSSCARNLLSYRQDPTFWHALTRKTFRIPEQPLLRGARWQWLYKKLLTQTRLYTWGNNQSGNLGHTEINILSNSRGHRTLRRSGWPQQPEMTHDVGIISDVQCGGWSTTLLNSIGQVYMFGIFDGLLYRPSGGSQLRLLGFPPGYPPTKTGRYEPSTAIKQYSTGRSSVLGLSDDGKVWSWTSDTAVLIKSVHVDLMDNKVLEVQTGWNRSSMYVQDVGLVYWSSDSDSDLLRGGRQQALEVADAILIDTVTIPDTGYRRKRSNRSLDESPGVLLGQVTHYVVLEAHIVFTTDLNKVFSYATSFPMSTVPRPEPVELTSFYSTSSDQPFEIRDLQGTFCNFAIFTRSGVISTGSRELLETFHRRAAECALETSPEPFPQPTTIPSLQSREIISLAFGDHHLHALDGDGTVTSLGTECQHCGAFGLGSDRESVYRGVHSSRQRWGDGRLPRETETLRTIWFEPLMEIWLDHVIGKSEIPESESHARGELIRNQDPDGIEAMGDYFEKEGRKWEHGVTQDGEMRGHFVLKVAAAGWHSAALVLVDDEKVEQARANHIKTPRSAQQNQNTDNDVDYAYNPSVEHTRKSGPPSLASNETIDSPSEQLAHAVTDACSWLWNLGRRFLGLVRRDELRNKAGNPAAAAAAAAASTDATEGTSNGDAAEQRYTWEDDVLPRLRMRTGEIMPGTIEVTDLYAE